MPAPVLPILTYDGSGYKSFVDRHISYRVDENGTAEIYKITNEIVNDVKNNGDQALFKWSAKFDCDLIDASNVRVSQHEIDEACGKVEPELQKIFCKAIDRIYDFHKKQKTNGWIDTSANGEILGQIVRPIDSCGIYVPGGTAAYPSSVLMTVVPAKTAGVKRVAVASPCGRDGKIPPVTLVAAKVSGVDEIYKVGGAQAIAAFAYGTESIKKTDKIMGPGNSYVMTAKRIVYGQAGIDSMAGPSEIAIIADSTANPVFVAADMLSQAEHDARAKSVLFTDSPMLAEKVSYELVKQTKKLKREKIISESLNQNGQIILTDTIAEAVELANAMAPEHLAVCTAEPLGLLTGIRHAGSVFIGNYSPEALGDYMAGPSHVLPTESTARFFSPLSVDDFVKKTSLISFSKEALERLRKDIETFSNAEGFDAHANAVSVRFE
ncbi:MAG: histidinol dehydrogenase [Defluviitaleaceae bacterium]|nr:histidinol dehydrogenase [Defluviitaleaceae bacterium]